MVGITAGCDVTDALGAALIGVGSGFLVVFGVWFLDNKLHVDDPVGAVAVHMMNGIWGTLAVGLFATSSAPAFSRGFGDGVSFGANQIVGVGLFYGGGFKQLGIQILGCFSTATFTAITITLVFLLIKKIFGLRVSAEEEIIGLDKLEHGLDSGYAGFAIPYSAEEIQEAKEAGIKGFESTTTVPVEKAIPVAKVSSHPNAKFTKITIITRQSKFDDLKAAMNSINITGMTVTNVLGCGVQHGQTQKYRGTDLDITLLPKIQVDIVVSEVPVDLVITKVKEVLYTGHIGDGKIFVYDVENVVKVRTGEEGYDALQD